MLCCEFCDGVSHEEVVPNSKSLLSPLISIIRVNSWGNVAFWELGTVVWAEIPERRDGVRAICGQF